MKIFRYLIFIQSFYTLLTAVWPLVHIQSFMAVTGPKTDIWLVKTVGALLIPVGTCLLVFMLLPTSDKRPAIVLGSLSSVAFICIDFYYTLTDVISNVYLVDGFVQILLLSGWVYFATKNYHGLFEKRARSTH